MKLKTIVRIAVAAYVLVALLATPALPKDKLEAKAKVSKSAARKTALAKVPGGKVKESELEEENGKLIWSFDIATKGSKDITEVQVDAISGEVVAVHKETPAQQAEEKAQDAREKKAAKEKQGAKEKKSEKDDDDKDEKK